MSMPLLPSSDPPPYYGATQGTGSPFPPTVPSQKSYTSLGGIPADVQSGSGQTMIVVDNTKLRPGICCVCRKGEMKEQPTTWTWVACLLLLAFGIIPGLVAYCCLFRRPKCTSCGYTA